MKPRLRKRGSWWYCKGHGAYVCARTYVDAYHKWLELVSR